MPAYRTGNNAFAVQQVGYGSSGAVANTANMVDGAGFFSPIPLYPGGIRPTKAALILGEEAEEAVGAISGSGAATQPAADGSGQALEVFRGGSALAQPAATGAATASQVFRGSAALAQSASGAAGVAELVFAGGGSATQPAGSQAGAGVQAFRAAATGTQPGALAAGAARLVFLGPAAASIAPSTGSATGGTAAPPLAGSARWLPFRFDQTVALPVSGRAVAEQRPAAGAGDGRVIDDELVLAVEDDELFLLAA